MNILAQTLPRKKSFLVNMPQCNNRIVGWIAMQLVGLAIILVGELTAEKIDQ